MNREKFIRKCGILAGWLAVWFGLAVLVDNRILLVTPIEAFRTLTDMLGRGSFYFTLGSSLLRIGMGFMTGFGAAVLLAVGSRRHALLEEALSPLMNLIKTIPVASFVVMLLIWAGPSFLSSAVSFLVVLPNIYMNTLEGLKSTDPQLLDMARVFRLPFWNRFFYIYRPALKPFLYGSLKVSLGMCWKSGVAAEVIGTPDYSIGEQMYLSKVYLDTAGLFAWTAVVILFSVIFEKMIMLLADKFFAWEPGCRRQLPDVSRHANAGGGHMPASVRLSGVTKSYGGKKVLDNFSAVYEPDRTYYLTSPSGSGKTTLLRMIAGLTEPDGGGITPPSSCGMVFQEDRLCEDYSAVKNVELVIGDRRRAEEALCQLLDKDALYKPCRQLSGGMKRRAALVRAMESDSACVLLDEPFTGMDARTRERAEEYIRRRQKNRILIIATHI